MSKSKIADRELMKMRETLDEILPRDLRWWVAMANHNKQGLLTMSNLPHVYALKGWNQIPPSHRLRILKTAITVSNWVHDILGCEKCRMGENG